MNLAAPLPRPATAAAARASGSVTNSLREEPVSKPTTGTAATSSAGAAAPGSSVVTATAPTGSAAATGDPGAKLSSRSARAQPASVGSAAAVETTTTLTDDTITMVDAHTGKDASTMETLATSPERDGAAAINIVDAKINNSNDTTGSAVAATTTTAATTSITSASTTMNPSSGPMSSSSSSSSSSYPSIATGTRPEAAGRVTRENRDALPPSTTPRSTPSGKGVGDNADAAKGTGGGGRSNSNRRHEVVTRGVAEGDNSRLGGEASHEPRNEKISKDTASSSKLVRVFRRGSRSMLVLGLLWRGLFG